jgi:hypothetical protein
MTYGITLHYDVEVDFIYYSGEERKESIMVKSSTIRKHSI